MAYVSEDVVAEERYESYHINTDETHSIHNVRKAAVMRLANSSKGEPYLTLQFQVQYDDCNVGN